MILIIKSKGLLILIIKSKGLLILIIKSKGLLILIIKSKGLLILIIIISKPLEHNLNNSTRRIICTVHRKGLGIGGLTN